MGPSIGEHAEDREAVEFGGEAPTVEVVVFRHGEEVHRQLCESSDSASDVVAEWAELDGVECFVDDLAVKHEVGEILEPDADEPFDDDAYPHVTRDEYD